MGRLIRIAIYALIILVLYFWVNAIIRSYSDQKPMDLTSNEVIDSISDAVEMNGSFDTSTMDLGYPITNKDIVDGRIDYTEVDEKLESLERKKLSQSQSVSEPKEKLVNTSVENTDSKSASPPKSKENENKKNIVSTSGSVAKGDGGSYLVMAGSYLLKDNANQMVKKLKNIGYSDAEVIIFSASEFHSVIAVRYSSESKAKAAAADLKRKGIDSFVKSR